MKMLRQWLIKAEHQLNLPLVYRHCDFEEIKEHINLQQVVCLDSYIHSCTCNHLTVRAMALNIGGQSFHSKANVLVHVFVAQSI